MKHFKLSARLRQPEQMGKKAAKAIRKAGDVPVVLYGCGEPQHLVIKEDELNKLIYTPEIYLVELDVEGKQHNAVLKEAQFHPVTDKTLHVDLYEVTPEKPIVMKVPISLEGHAIGVKAGGKLVREKRTLRVRATYDNIPEILTINVAKLRLGKTIQVRELSFEGLELVDAPEAVVCAVKLTRAARGKGATAAIEEEEEEAAE